MNRTLLPIRLRQALRVWSSLVRLLCGPVAGLGAADAQAASASNYTWRTGAASGDWFTAANWNPAGVPGSSDAVTIASGSVNAGGGQLINLPGGLIDVTADVSVGRAGYGRELIANAGTVRKSGGTNTAAFAPPLSNSGTVDVETGTLRLNSGYVQTPGTLNFGLNSIADYGRLQVNANAQSGGTLSAILSNGYSRQRALLSAC